MSLETRLRPSPLSPHLVIYRRTMVMMMSITSSVDGRGALLRNAVAYRLVGGVVAIAGVYAVLKIGIQP